MLEASPSTISHSLRMAKMNWSRRNPAKTARAIGRCLDGLREVGLLLVAFGPLEAAVNRTSLRDAAGFLVLFFGGGLVLFGTALILEWGYQDER